MLKVGEKDSGDNVVMLILGQSDKNCVYITKDNQLRWNIEGDVPSELIPVVNKFDLLMTEVKSAVSEKHKNECLTLLGKSLYAAMNEKTTEKALRYFDGVEQFVQSMTQQQKQATYVFVCILVTIILTTPSISILHIMQPQHAHYFYGACLGAIGACISVMQRAVSVDVNWRLDLFSLVLHAVIRITLGLLFGAVFVLACKADFLFGEFKTNPRAIYLLAMVAGFSERMIPDLFSRLELNEGKKPI